MSNWGSAIDDLFANATGDIPFSKVLEAYNKSKGVHAFARAKSVMKSSETQVSQASAVSDTIQSKLEEVNNRTVDKNPLTRISEKAARHNSLVSKMSVSINGVDFQGVEQAKMKIPEVFRLPTDIKPHVSNGSVNHRGKQVKLECEWRV